MKRLLPFLLLALTACSPLTDHFRYEPVSAIDVTSIAEDERVVIGPQDSAAEDAEAVARVHALNGRVFRYVQFYWSPLNRPYQSIDIAARPDWQLCFTGATPATDDTVHTTTWAYLDMNERAARNEYTRYLRSLTALGYDGVFIDMGGTALHDQRRSTCTSDPVVPGRTIAESYLGIMRQARSVGLAVYLNAGRATELPSVAYDVGLDAVLDEAHVPSDYPALRNTPAPVTVLIRPSATSDADVRRVRDAHLAVACGVRTNEECS